MKTVTRHIIFLVLFPTARLLSGLGARITDWALNPKQSLVTLGQAMSLSGAKLAIWAITPGTRFMRLGHRIQLTGQRIESQATNLLCWSYGFKPKGDRKQHA